MSDLCEMGRGIQPIGSGGNIRQIQNNTVTFGASDMPLKPDQLSVVRYRW
jgi:phosphate transport system substrate-binding protein